MNDQNKPSSSRSDLVHSYEGLVEQGVYEAVTHKTRMAMTLADPNLPDAPLVYVNPAFCNLTGYDVEASVGRNCRFLQGPQTDRETVSRIRQAVLDRETIHEEIYNYRRDGSGFWNALFLSPIFDDDGALIYYFGSQIDVSARKEAQRRQSQRTESLSALVSGIAHEFNNLMTVVLGNIERVAMHAHEPGERRHLERADWGATRAGELASQLLSLSRHQEGRAETIDLNHAVRDLKDALDKTIPSSVQLHLELAPIPVLVQVELGQFELALTHLVRNAVEAMPDGGQVSVITRVLEPHSAPGDVVSVELIVADTGCGMQPHVAERATELFFTTKTSGEGTGLGLFLVLEFVDKSAGRVSIDSKPGEGTRVSMVFPQARDRRA